MPITLDVDDVAGRLKLALKEVAGADMPLLSQYGEAKVRAVAEYAGLIGDAYAAGALDDDEMRQELREIERMTHRFMRNLKGVAGVKAEQAGRAAVSILLGAMRTGLSFAGTPLPAKLTEPTAS